MVCTCILPPHDRNFGIRLTIIRSEAVEVVILFLMIARLVVIGLLLFTCVGKSFRLMKSCFTRTLRSKAKATTSSVEVQARSDGKSLGRFMQVGAWKDPRIAELVDIVRNIACACKDICRLTRRLSSDGLQGVHLTSTGHAWLNVHGEYQQVLDHVANRIMKNAVCSAGSVAIVSSEEDEDVCTCTNVLQSDIIDGPYSVVFDPLDGSSNIDSGLPSGSIFGIYRTPPIAKYEGPNLGCMRKGDELAAAGYCLYSAATQLVLTMRNGVHIFTLDEQTGDFQLSKSQIRVPCTGPIISFNSAYANSWASDINLFLSDLAQEKVPGLDMSRPKSRYLGALVADAHNVLMNGGIFGYPATTTRPDGKLRLLYEANPLALIMEEAGGMATDGRDRILTKQVDSIHQRTPLYLGSVEVMKAFLHYCS